jgi:hypothetical protein
MIAGRTPDFQHRRIWSDIAKAYDFCRHFIAGALKKTSIREWTDFDAQVFRRNRTFRSWRLIGHAPEKHPAEHRVPPTVPCDVRYWLKAGITSCTAHVRLWG